jgi:hypothetical protein
VIDSRDNLNSCLSPIIQPGGMSGGKSSGYNSAMLPDFKGLAKENKSLKKNIKKLEKSL